MVSLGISQLVVLCLQRVLRQEHSVRMHCADAVKVSTFCRFQI